MNGYSLLFGVLVIVAIAIIIGALVLTLAGGMQFITLPAWRRRKTHHGALHHFPDARESTNP